MTRLPQALALLVAACGSSAAPRGPTAATGGSPLELASHRQVRWGYGCGGNCAFNTSGSSDVTLVAAGGVLRLVDEGTSELRTADPEGVMTVTTTWRWEWRGAVPPEGGDAKLQRKSAECRRVSSAEAEERVEECPAPPARITLRCVREEVPVLASTSEPPAPREVWVCRADPAPGGDNTGTALPWVFGIDEMVETHVTGEPRPETTYFLTGEP